MLHGGIVRFNHTDSHSDTPASSRCIVGTGGTIWFKCRCLSTTRTQIHSHEPDMIHRTDLQPNLQGRVLLMTWHLGAFLFTIWQHNIVFTLLQVDTRGSFLSEHPFFRGKSWCQDKHLSSVVSTATRSPIKASSPIYPSCFALGFVLSHYNKRCVVSTFSGCIITAVNVRLCQMVMH